MGYLYLPGTSGNDASASYTWPTADSGTMTLTARVSADNWTSLSGSKAMIGSTNSHYLFRIYATSTMRCSVRDDATGLQEAESSTTVPFSDGDIGWCKAEVDFTNNTCDFYTSTSDTNDPASVAWTQLGTQQALTSGTRTANSMVAVGSGNQASTLQNWGAGGVYRAVVQFDGTATFDADFTDLTAAEVAAAQFTEDSTNAATVTINGTGWTYVSDSKPNLMLLGVG